jgi:K+-dependent Na+/Ca+ exchanger-like protein
VRRHAPLAIAGAAALLAIAGFASRSTSDEPRRLSEIGNCLTSSSCPDVWEPVCAAAADHPNKANASTFELNSTHLYTYASACIAAECGTAVVQSTACNGFADVVCSGPEWEQPPECAMLRLNLKAAESQGIGNFGMTLAQLRSGGVILNVLGMLYMFVALAIVCDEYFVPCLEIICEKLDISDDVAGATFMAAGGSMPELATSFIGAFTGSAVGFGTIIGSAVFNVLFVIGMCAIASKEVLVLTWWPLARDVSYYSLSLILVVVFFGAISRCQIEWWEALILLLLYFVYCAFMKFNQRVYAALVRAFPRLGPPVGPPPGQIENVDTFSANLGARLSRGNLDVASVQVEIPGAREAEIPPTIAEDASTSGTALAAPAPAPMRDTPTPESVSGGAASAASGSGALPPECSRGSRGSRMSEQSVSRSSNMSRGSMAGGQANGRPRTVTRPRPSVMRAGVLQYMVNDVDLVERVGTHVVAKIKGDLQETFDRLDEDGDGQISASELAALLAEVNQGQAVDEQSVQRVMSEVAKRRDAEGNGIILFDDFRKW